MKRYGYIRVSSKDQNPDRQYDALLENGVQSGDIYVDRLSGKNFDRPMYKSLIRRVRKGDVIVILSIDRLGRNYDEILEQWRIITKEREVHIEVIDMPLLNTQSEREGLTGVFIADLVLQILAYVAETERAFIRQRQAEGIAAAKERGVRFGAERKDLGYRFEECYRMWCDKEITLKEGAAALGVSVSTFYRRCREIEKADEKSSMAGAKK